MKPLLVVVNLGVGKLRTGSEKSGVELDKNMYVLYGVRVDTRHSTGLRYAGKPGETDEGLRVPTLFSSHCKIHRTIHRVSSVKG